MEQLYLDLKQALPDSVVIEETPDGIKIPQMKLSITYFSDSFMVFVFLYDRKFSSPSEVCSFVVLAWKKYCNTKALFETLKDTLSTFNVDIYMINSGRLLWNIGIEDKDEPRRFVPDGFLQDYTPRPELVRYDIGYDELCCNISVTDKIRRVTHKFTDTSELGRMLQESLQEVLALKP